MRRTAILSYDYFDMSIAFCDTILARRTDVLNANRPEHYLPFRHNPQPNTYIAGIFHEYVYI